MKTIAIPRTSIAEGSLILVNGQYPYRGEISEKSYLRTRCSINISMERSLQSSMWHFRYVGAPHAAIIAERGLALEGYHKYLKDYPKENPLRYRNGDRRFAISYVAAESDACTKLEIDEDIPYLISGNNTDGFILTEWKSTC